MAKEKEQNALPNFNAEKFCIQVQQYSVLCCSYGTKYNIFQELPM